MTTIRRFWHDQSAATSIEYAMIGVLISVVIVAAAGTIGTNLNAKFQKVSTGLT